MDKPAFISLTFDDGLRCQFEQAVPILEQYRFSATFFLVANTDPTHTDGGQHPDWRKTDWSEKDVQFFKSMIQQGHEIGAHSVHHRHPFLDNDPKGENRKFQGMDREAIGHRNSFLLLPVLLPYSAHQERRNQRRIQASTLGSK
jgi:peptidoglycan/xylan/chitin deacetylase (PgdA/CDA1 family)